MSNGRRTRTLRILDISTWPLHLPATHLSEFLRYGGAPLSHRAAAGFLSRVRVSRLKFPNGFPEAVSAYVERLQERVA